MKTHTLTRVLYGKKDTPMKIREYAFTIGGPVGTKEEWRKWAKDNNVKIKFKELTNNQRKKIKELDKAFTTEMINKITRRSK